MPPEQKFVWVKKLGPNDVSVWEKVPLDLSKLL